MSSSEPKEEDEIVAAAFAEAFTDPVVEEQEADATQEVSTDSEAEQQESDSEEVVIEAAFDEADKQVSEPQQEAAAAAEDASGELVIDEAVFDDADKEVKSELQQEVAAEERVPEEEEVPEAAAEEEVDEVPVAAAEEVEVLPAAEEELDRVPSAFEEGGEGVSEDEEVEEAVGGNDVAVAAPASAAKEHVAAAAASEEKGDVKEVEEEVAEPEPVPEPLSEFAEQIEAEPTLQRLEVDQLFNLTNQCDIVLDIRPRKERLAEGILGSLNSARYFEVDISAASDKSVAWVRTPPVVAPKDLEIDTTDYSMGSGAVKRFCADSEWVHVSKILIICSETGSNLSEVLYVSQSLMSRAMKVARISVFVWDTHRHFAKDSAFEFMRLRTRRGVTYPNCILANGLFLGCAFAATDPLGMADLKPTAIVNATSGLSTPFAVHCLERTFGRLESQSKDVKYLESLAEAKKYFREVNGGDGIDYYCVPVTDTIASDISQYFDDVCALIGKHIGKGAVVIHCMAGASRSGALVLAYLIKAKRMTLYDAYCVAAARRPMMRPNPGFMLQLSEWEQKHLGKTTIEKLRLYG